jgi:tetratricopeptide (TPR) repeat protein
MKKLLIGVLILGMSATAWAGKKKDNECLPLDVYMRSAKIYMGALGVIPDFPSAQKQLIKATECYPAEGEPRFFTAKIYYRKRMYSEFLAATKALDTLVLENAFRDTLWDMRRAAWGELFNRGVDSLKASNDVDLKRDSVQGAGDAAAYDSLTNHGRRMLESARNLFLASLEMDSTRSEPFQNIAVINVRLQDWDEALRWFRAALVVTPDELDLKRNMMSLHMRLEQPDSAMVYTQSILETEPDDMEALINEASLYTSLGFPDSANFVFHEIIDKDPNNQPVLFNLGMTQVQQAQVYANDIKRHLKTMQESAKTYNKLAGENAKNSVLKKWEQKGADAARSLKEVQSNSDDAWGAASGLFERLAELDESDAEAFYYWGLAQFWMKNYEGSVAPLVQAVTLNDNYCAAWNVLQYSYSKAGQAEQSAEAKAKAENCTP